jgi:hypothetical protein
MLGSCEGQDEQNPLGGRPNDGINVEVAASCRQLPCKFAGRKSVLESFARDRTSQRSARASAPRGALFLRRPETDGTADGRKEVMRAE